MIIDSHAHIYPDKLARKAARSIGDFYDIDMSLDGTVDMLLKVGDEAGDHKFLCDFPLWYIWRRWRDLNPRGTFAPYSLSRGAPSPLG